jgi:ABC-type metal ion transport system substrate-binding protein
MRKKVFGLVIGAVLLFALNYRAEARGAQGSSGSTLTVGATPVPHAELLNLVKDDLAAEGITLKVVEFNDYVQPNSALIAGDLDANFFQHIPYLESNPEWKNGLASVFGGCGCCGNQRQLCLGAGINPVRNSLILEGVDSPYVNIAVVKRGNEKDPKFAALTKVLLSQKVKDYILFRYDRFLASLDRDGLPRTAVGFCLEAQLLSEIPAGSRDQKMDMICTRRGSVCRFEFERI